MPTSYKPHTTSLQCNLYVKKPKYEAQTEVTTGDIIWVSFTPEPQKTSCNIFYRQSNKPHDEETKLHV